MLRYGEKLDLDKNLWDAIVTYMNDDAAKKNSSMNT